MKSGLWMIPLIVAGCFAPRNVPAPAATAEEPHKRVRFDDLRRPIGVRVLDARSSAEASSGLAARTLGAIVSMLEQDGVEVHEGAPVGIEITVKRLAPEHRADVRLSCAKVEARWYERDAEFAPGGFPLERCVSEGATHGPATDLAGLYAWCSIPSAPPSGWTEKGSGSAERGAGSTAVMRTGYFTSSGSWIFGFATACDGSGRLSLTTGWIRTGRPSRADSYRALMIRTSARPS